MTLTSIELFSGSCTVSSVLKSHGFSTVTVDYNPKYKPSICCNIFDLLPAQLPSHIDFLWASPDCRCFSRAGNAALWQKKVIKYRQYKYVPISAKSATALLLVLKTINLIRVLSPTAWFIENPVGRMRHVRALQAIAPFRYSVNYKQYGFSYSKETDIYSNVYLNFKQKKIVIPGVGVQSVNSVYERSRVPGLLIDSIIKQCFNLNLFNR